MDYNIKMFKSKTVELGGNKFIVTHKSSGILSNNLWIYLAFVSFYSKLVYKKIFEPFVKLIKVWYDFFILLIFIICFISFVIGITTFAVTTFNIDYNIYTCIDNGLYCETILLHCEKEFLNNNLRNDLYACIYDIMNQSYWTEYRKNYSYWFSISFYYFIMVVLFCVVLIYGIRGINFSIQWITKKIMLLKNDFCDNIPNIEMV